MEFKPEMPAHWSPYSAMKTGMGRPHGGAETDRKLERGPGPS